MKKLISKFTAFIVGSLLITTIAHAEVAIIVSASNTNELNAEDIKRIFLGKENFFPDGSKVVPVGQEGNAVAEEFNSKVLDRTGTQLKAYWSKLVFTGKGVPPENLGSDAAILKAVAASTEKVGFVDSGSVDSSVRVVAKF